MPIMNESLDAYQAALLDTIAGPESGGMYNARYPGSTFTGYGAHPNIDETILSGPNKGLTSDAAGRYQFLNSTWGRVAKAIGVTDFSPASQDAGAWYLARTEYSRDTGRNLYADLVANDLSRVPGSLKDQWTSIPGGIEPNSATPTNFLAAFAANFSANGGNGAAPARLPDIGSSSVPGNASGLNKLLADIGDVISKPKGWDAGPATLAPMAGVDTGFMTVLNGLLQNFQLGNPQPQYATQPGFMSLLGGFFNALTQQDTTPYRLGISAAEIAMNGVMQGGATIMARGSEATGIPVGTNLGTAANGGQVIQGVNGQVNSISNRETYNDLFNGAMNQAGTPLSDLDRIHGGYDNRYTSNGDGSFQSASGGVYYDRHIK